MKKSTILKIFQDLEDSDNIDDTNILLSVIQKGTRRYIPINKIEDLLTKTSIDPFEEPELYLRIKKLYPGFKITDYITW